MCGVVGFLTREENDEFDRDFFIELMRQSKIRGLHATGMSWIQDRKVMTKKEHVTADKFDYPAQLGRAVVGHCRYSTSYLEYNQPNATDKLSIVHNGVVTQELYENWEKLYSYKCKTKNDSELLLHALNNGQHPLSVFPDSSMACAFITYDGKLHAFRNDQRPLWITITDSWVAITSTRDIMKRAAKKFYNEDIDHIDSAFEVKPTKMNWNYSFWYEDGHLVENERLIEDAKDKPDLQEALATELKKAC